MVALHLSEQVVSIELLVVEDKHARTGKPLPVELSPYGFAPSGVCHSQVDGVFLEVMPEHTRREVPQGIEVVVCHHLGLAAGTAGEIHQHSVIVGVDMLRTYEGRSIRPLFLPGMPYLVECGVGSVKRTFLVLRIDSINSDDSLHRWTVG